MRGNSIFRTITFRTMLQNRTRTIVTVIGVILSTAMITAVTTFGSSFMGFLSDYARQTEGDWHVAVLEASAEEAEKLLADGRIEAAAEVQNIGFAKWENCTAGGNPWGYLRIKSLPAEKTDMIPIQLYSGRMPETDSEILLPWFLPANEAEDNQTEIGDTMELEIGALYTKDGEAVTYETDTSMPEPGEEKLRGVQKRIFTVTGFYESGHYSGRYGGWSDLAFDTFCGPGARQAQGDIFIRLKNPADAFSFAENVAEEHAGVYTNYGLLRWQGVFSNDRASTVIIGLFALVIGIIMVGAISLIYNAFSISVRERTTQFGLLSSIGATQKQLRRALFYEAIFVSVIGIPIGLASGIAGIGITLHYISFGITMMVHGIEQQIVLRVPLSVLALTAALAAVTIAVSAWVPSGRIRRISPMEAIRASRDIRIIPRRLKTGKGVVRLFGVPGLLAQKNYRRDRKKYRTTVFSLTMSIVLFVSAVTISDSLRNTGSFVLEAPEMEIQLIVYDNMTGERQQEIRDLFLRHPEVETSYMYRSLYQYLEVEPEMLAESVRADTLEVEGKQVLGAECIFVADEWFGELLKEAGVRTDTCRADGAAKALLYDYRKNYNPLTQRYEKLQIFTDSLPEKCVSGNLGTETEEAEENGDASVSRMSYTANFTIDMAARIEQLPEGIVDNYESTPFLILPMSVLEMPDADFAESAPYRFTVEARDYRTAYDELEKELQATGLMDEGDAYLSNMMESYERDRNFLMAVEVLCFGFTILISLIALANVFNTVSTNLLLRRREFAMLRSMGLSPKDSRKMLFLESVSYSVRAVVYGGVLSIIVAILTWDIIRIGADNIFRVPWQPIVIAAAVVYLMVAGTMALTMRKINNTTICEELKLGGM